MKIEADPVGQPLNNLGTYNVSQHCFAIYSVQII